MKRTPPVIRALNTLLVGLILFVCVGFFYDVATTPKVAQKPIPEQLQALSPQPQIDFNRLKPSGRYEDLASHAMFAFGTSRPEPESTAAPAQVRKPLNADLRLIGTIVTGASEHKGLAIIQPGLQRPQRLMAVGDTIDGYRIDAVMRDRVVLRRQQESFVLTIGKKHASVSASTPRPSAPETPGTFIETTHLKRIAVLTAMGNTRKTLDQIEVVPYYQSGRAEGLEIQNLAPDSVFSQMRLQPGDVIRNINGYQIRSLEDAAKAYEKIKTASEFQLVLLRDGHPRTFNFVIE